MHYQIGENDEGTTEDRKPDAIRPQGFDFKAERGQNRGPRHFNI